MNIFQGCHVNTNGLRLSRGLIIRPFNKNTTNCSPNGKTKIYLTKSTNMRETWPGAEPWGLLEQTPFAPAIWEGYKDATMQWNA